MASEQQNKQTRRKGSHSGSRKPQPQPFIVTVRKVEGENTWELVHPQCAQDRQDDLNEVRRMVELGETEVAVDELRWLLQGCSDFLDVHRLLGELALEKGDYPLARGHFGYAFRIGSKVIGDPPTGRFPNSQPGNQGFLESAKGLAWCLFKLDKPGMAREVVQTLLACDPSDPLGVRTWLKEAP